MCFHIYTEKRPFGICKSAMLPFLGQILTPGHLGQVLRLPSAHNFLTAKTGLMLDYHHASMIQTKGVDPKF